ncbi:omega-6 fatty acid desaturase (delta-12 desaturase) [Enhydrobacter aerosaccus]|uniref:Omega-6 fatty acid desaturase (Delta-12 desaturase) n=1 Tax=Enhydrobacter aerosaccus TaxID=225324 RepID=A0A1T4TD42_9HYPH|nr:fatty acid desaturase [Enhydrobacter aerosaccus]SKA38251.1 omega-6 fatty acid desaturase (delta-12 desaturase) [Enhydrobacter aerosaccus]
MDTLIGDIRRTVASFARPDLRKGILQLFTSFGPFLAACAAMYLVYPIAPLLSLALAVPTGALLVRVFIVQHDCGHSSFFASNWANVVVGRVCSVVTLTPFANWARQHSMHHGNWNNLDRRAGSDLYSACLTVREYEAMTPWKRWLYRLPRHPLIANLILPPLVFVVLYRLPFDTPRTWKREWRSVWLTNAAILAIFGALVLAVGWRQVLLIHLPIMVVASILGVWLFSLQHRFESTYWARRADWSPFEAAMRGSSWFALPRVLHWLTGNIGFHHIHHLNTRVPNYRLSSAHEAIRPLYRVQPLSLMGGLRAPWLTLWDEATGRLVRFRDVRPQSA